MSNIPYTTQRSLQFAGPTNSDDYNLRIEQNYDDLVLLYNRVRLDESIIQDEYGRFVKDQFGLMQLLADMDARLAALEAQVNTLVFYSDTQIDTALFNGTQYAIPAVNQCQIDTAHGLITLPIVPDSSTSKLVFIDSNNNVNVPSTLGTTVVGSGADSGSAVIDSSPVELAIGRETGSIWQRNVIVTTPVVNGAQLTLYIAAPVGLFTTANSNCIMLHPFPAFSTNINEVAYTTNTAPTMSDSDGYLDFPANFTNNSTSVGWTPPGSWPGDADINAGFRTYYFDPIPITGLRIQLQQTGYFYDLANYVYSYGASLIDLRYVKFVSTGQIIIRFDAPTGDVINNVDSVTPSIFNVSPALLPEIFSYQVIYETAYLSGSYTTTPVPLSQRVWVKVTLNQTPSSGTPSLSGLAITYS